MSSVSHCFQCILRWRRAQQAYPSGRVGTVIRHRAFAQQCLDDRRSEHLRSSLELIGGAQGPLAGKNRDFLTGVEDLGRTGDVRLGRKTRWARVARRLCARTFSFARGGLVASTSWMSVGNADMCDPVSGKAVRHASGATFAICAAPMTRVL